MSIITFGDDLLRTGDLDPLYIALHNAAPNRGTLERFCLAYWCLYHAGAASKLAEIKSPPKFWRALMVAAVNEGLAWPRGSERRHFRGANAINAVNYLITRYKTPAQAIYGFLGIGHDYFTGADRGGIPMTYASVAEAAQSHVGFGPWIAFKIADMSERVLGFPTDFADCELGIYKDPRQGAAVAFLERKGVTGTVAQDGKQVAPWEFRLEDAQLKDTAAFYVATWRKKRAKAPPAGDRLVNVQEVETIFCKYKSHLKGHYPLGKDTREIGHGLDGWGDLAQQLKAGLPAVAEQRKLF